MIENNVDHEVLVIGAGMAGLSAARSLSVREFKTLVLEAQARIGGRILTQRVCDEVVELGAEFVHGRPPELLALIEEAGLKLIERTGSFVHRRRGLLTTNGDIGGDIDDDRDPFRLLGKVKDFTDRDVSFAEFLDQQALADQSRDQAVGFAEGFNAADHRVISARALGLQQKAEDAIEGDRSFHVRGGYVQLPEFLAMKLGEHSGQLRLNTRVKSVRWHPGRVVVQTSAGTFTAQRAVIALPLGVLQSGGVEFEPALPERVSRCFLPGGPIRVGAALRFTIIFRERFWQSLAPQPAMSELSFLISRETTPPVWWTPHPEESNALTGWIGGPLAAKLGGQSAKLLAELGCKALAEILDRDARHIHGLVTGCLTHDWSGDIYSRGAYSYIAKDGVEAPGMLAESISETLYFAGEHTVTDGHWGTVHAALSSGLRAADQISISAGIVRMKPATAR